MRSDAPGLIGEIAPVGIVVREADPRGVDINTELPPEERAAIATAVPKRQREFIAGRLLARAAMVALGRPPVPIPRTEHRAPVWPEGLVGSLSHTDRWCVAALTTEFRAIGVDVEEDAPLDPATVPMICTEAERRALARLSEVGALAEAKRIFSAKESVFKLLSPLLDLRFIGHHEVTVRFDGMTWAAVPESPELADRLAQTPLRGRWTQQNGLIGTLIALS